MSINWRSTFDPDDYQFFISHFDKNQREKQALECQAAALYRVFENDLIDLGETLTNLRDIDNHFTQAEFQLIIIRVGALKTSVQDHGRRDASLPVNPSPPPQVAINNLCDALNAVRKKTSSENITDAKAQLQEVLRRAQNYVKFIDENDMLALNHKEGDREFLDGLAHVGRVPEWLSRGMIMNTLDLLKTPPRSTSREVMEDRE